MDQKYEKFSAFDWSDERWQMYLSGLYPPPNYKQVSKFKKKWYKKTIDPDFDVDYEPSSSSGGCASTGADGSGCGGTPFGAASSDNCHVWVSSRLRASVCFMAYVCGLMFAAASVVGVVEVQSAIGLLAGAFLLELLARHGVQFRRDYLQLLLREDVGHMPLAAVVAFIPGLHKPILVLMLVPFGIAAVLSLAQISKARPGPLDRLLRPLTEVQLKYALMQAKADLEVVNGFVFIGLAGAKLTSVATPLWFWNTLAIKYALSPWTQAAFRKVDGAIRPVLGRIPLVSRAYEALKNFLHMFCESKQRSSCDIL